MSFSVSFHVILLTIVGVYRSTYKLGVRVRARILTTVPDSTSQKFMLVGQVSRSDSKGNDGRYVVVFLDFAKTRSRKCGEADFETWYARSSTNDECLMGHKVRFLVTSLDEHAS